MAFRIRKKKNVNIKRVVAKISVTVLTLYVGGTILNEVGDVLLFTQSPFYEGLSLIGWTIGDYPLYNTTNYAVDCANSSVGGTVAPGASGCITAVTGSGILTVIGLVAIASIVMEFVDFSF